MTLSIPLSLLLYMVAMFFTFLILVGSDLLLKLFSLAMTVFTVGLLILLNSYSSWSWLLLWLGILGGLIVSLSMAFIVTPKINSSKDWSSSLSFMSAFWILTSVMLSAMMWKVEFKEWSDLYSTESVSETYNSLLMDLKVYTAVVILLIYILMLPVMEVLTSPYSRSSAAGWGIY
uniref:NADH dehydrogenase subunit 5 n=2 Tax=Pediculus humanus TaxID=121225 RepID=X2D261_PEDHC|nr:NADH dehydrogenase subunit 5 [Pediculus humanus capitis]AHF70472.1 NADH dehydrogenase subunit 5 [Pediculus humanus corporis]AHF70484.1 NADH dehydrogenase subunit 5 [Pediculus humanus corporis]AHF70487.1 NADH dehydrogenase subunit 5 [Pediculus humanus capitis]AHF70489.1 NADH dehydrogenase subunit 5 [Pediculus humanus capitis]